MAASDRSTATRVAMISAAATILAATIGGVFALLTREGHSSTSSTQSTGVVVPTISPGNVRPTVPSTIVGETAVYLSKESGPGGTQVLVSGQGFSPGETVTVRFHTEVVATTKADAGGRFSNVAITIPTSFSQFAPQQFDVIATGRSSLRAGSAPFTISG